MKVSKTSKTKQKLLEMYQRQKLPFFGHVQKNHDDLIQRTMQTGIIPRKRKQGRQGCMWTDDIEEWTGIKLTYAIKATDNI